MASAALSDPAQIGLPRSAFQEFEKEAQRLIRSAPSESQKARLKSMLELAVEWWNADRRWLGLQLEPVFDVTAYFLDDQTWKVMPSTALKDLLKADVDRKDARFPKAYGDPFRLDPALIKEATGQLWNSHKARTGALWQEWRAAVKGAIVRRLGRLGVEHDDMCQALQINVERAGRRAEVEDERQRQMLTGQADAARRILEFTETAAAARIRWLDEAPARLLCPEPDWLGTVLFRPVPYQDF